VSRFRHALVAGLVLVASGGRRRRDRPPRPPRVVPPGPKEPRAELLANGLLGLAALCAGGFVAVYALNRIGHRTQFLGLTLGLSLLFVALALTVVSKRLVVDEELTEQYPPPEHVEETERLERLLEESGSRFTRARLFKLALGGAGAALGVALIIPAASLGPVLDVARFYGTPWRRGRRLVDEAGKPIRAADIEQAAFYTAYPEGADREQLGSPVVLVRLDPAELQLPPERQDWAPGGILAYSRICTHAGCAINLYRKPTYAPTEPGPALVCPCHYSTFDPAQAGKVLFGPAGRPLPQLPLTIDPRGELRAAGNFSGPVGPSWWGVRNKSAKP
jgi:ubiquinol-cytochrome c reductase iron-sulfur subunit